MKQRSGYVGSLNVDCSSTDIGISTRTLMIGKLYIDHMNVDVQLTSAIKNRFYVFACPNTDTSRVEHIEHQPNWLGEYQTPRAQVAKIFNSKRRQKSSKKRKNTSV